MKPSGKAYDGDGNVWRKTLTSTTDTLPNGLYQMVIDYIDGFEYHDGTFASYMHPQGRIAPGENGINCEYFIKDHLGSVRVVYADVDRDEVIDFDTVECELLEEHHYYPFGLEMEGMWSNFRTGQYVNRYTYNGKQAQTEMGWDWINYGARYYDGLIGRWASVDPLADGAPDWTPYRYAFNNPFSIVDPDGRFESKAEAKAYAKLNEIKLGVFSDHHVEKVEGGTFAITTGGKISYYFGSGSTDPAIVRPPAEYGTVGGIWGQTNAPQSAGGAFSDAFGGFMATALSFSMGGLSPSSLTRTAVAGQAATGVSNLAVRSDIIIKGGRSGQLLKNATGPANSVVKGGAEGRVLITNQKGQVIWDITKDRAKSVIPGQGFGPKVAPTKDQLNQVKQIWGI